MTEMVTRYPGTGAKKRPTKAKGETLCRTCQQIVGVTRTPWNRSTSFSEPLPKTTPHQWRGSRCPGSLLSVEPSTVFEVA